MRLLKRAVWILLGLMLLYVVWNAADVWRTSKRNDQQPSDAIVVMGAAQYNGRPSAVFRSRLDQAAQLYRDGVAPLIVVLGGKQEGDKETEAQAGAAYLEKKFSADVVAGVKAGSSTLDSLQQFEDFAKRRAIQTIVVVSDPLHLARARTIASDLGFDSYVSAANLPQSVDKQRLGLAKETARLLYYRVLGRG